MRFPRLTHRVALGMGAIGLVLASGGAATAAVSAIQPAGALSAQVPAVGVREQNVNSAGRIRVALPKGSIGVNGSVSVSNLPENSAGRVKVQNGSGAWHQVFGGASNVGSTPHPVVSVSGAGTFKGLQMSIQGVGTNGINNVYVTVVADGQVVFSRSWFAYVCCWSSTPVMGATSPNASIATPAATGMLGHSASMWFYPPGGIAFSHSLQIDVSQPGATGGQSDDVFAWYSARA